MTSLHIFFTRFWARAIDMVVIFLLVGVFCGIYSFFIDKNWLELWFWGVIILIPYLYFGIYQPLLDYLGGTIGKRLMGIVVCKASDSTMPTFFQLLLRNWIYILPICLLIPFQNELLTNLGVSWLIGLNIIGNLAILWSSTQQTWCDNWSKTIVKETK